MKAKKKSVNIGIKACTKKIITRNMQNKIDENAVVSITSSFVNNKKTKPSPNTRAKSCSTGKSDTDPYSFSKMEEECKITAKKIKIREKSGKDASVNTCHFSTMTEPELLGPCEPGTSIELQGIVWLETDTGLLVINVTWRGRTYVGTLLDSTKYEFGSPLISQDYTGKCESRLSNRHNRGKRRYMPQDANNITSLRSTSIRHSHRLSESLSYPNNKKSSSRLALNNSCYIDSLSLSAEASCNGESDLESNTYQKGSLGSKTRSVTRSLAKQNKTSLNEYDVNLGEINDLKSLEKCSQPNCFKQFCDTTALTYHLQRFHGIFEEISKSEKVDDNEIQENINEDATKIEESIYGSDEIKNQNELQKDLKRTKIKKENVDWELDSKSDDGILDHKLKNIQPKGNLIIDHKDNGMVDSVSVTSETICNKLPVLSLPLSNLPESVSVTEKSTSNVDSLLEGPESSSNRVSKHNASIVQTIEATLSLEVSGNANPSSNSVVRTVTAPTVSIPLEPTTNIANIGLSSSPNMSPTLVKPKLSQVSLNTSNSMPSRKLKTIKTATDDHGNSNSFQIPSSSSSKKRPLVPMKTAPNQSSTTNHNRPNIIATSNSHSSRHIRSSPFLNVTPILPATCIPNVSSLISTSVTSPGLCSSPPYSNCQTTSKRTVSSSNNISPSLLNSLISLKPIQPKPKCSSVVSTCSNVVPTTFINPITTTNLTGMMTPQTSYQRQILPSPLFRMENTNYSDERLIHKIECQKTTKKKRRKTEKKLRSTIQDLSRMQNLPLNPIQPKYDSDYKEGTCNNPVNGYKMDEENSHSPEYSDLSETNDTPAPILEKEIELRSIDCDKLIICTDYETTSTNKVCTSLSENFCHTKANSIYNKPPALIPAVLSADLLNGTTNDIDLSDPQGKTGRWKGQNNKRLPNSQDPNKDVSKRPNDNNIIKESVFSSSSRYSSTNTSNRKSFQSSSFEEKYSPSITNSPKVSLYSSTQNEFEKNSKLKISSKYSNLSAINDYVWMTKKGNNFKSKNVRRFDNDSYEPKAPFNEDGSKNKL